MRFRKFADAPAFRTTAPRKWPSAGSFAVIEWPAPSSVQPLGTRMVWLVSQSDSSVRVDVAGLSTNWHCLMPSSMPTMTGSWSEAR